MRLSKFSDVLLNWIVDVIPACRKAGETEGVLYAYAPSTHSHTRCSRTGSNRQLKRSCRLGHSHFREAKTTKRVEEFFGFSKFWISADKRRCCSLVMQSLAPFSSFWRPLKIFIGASTPLQPTSSVPSLDFVSSKTFLVTVSQTNQRLFTRIDTLTRRRMPRQSPKLGILST